jgi:hypothetical protein
MPRRHGDDHGVEELAGPAHHVLVDRQLLGDGADRPVLGVVEPADLRLDFRGHAHVSLRGRASSAS